MLIEPHQHVVRHQHLIVNIAGNPLCHVTVDLGLYSNKHHTWQQHIDHKIIPVCQKLARAQLASSVHHH